MSVVGIDFGSQACYIAAARQGGVETIDNDYSDRRTPTIVAYGSDRRLMGVSAKNKLVSNPKNTISGFRNVLGRGFSDPVTQEEIKNASFTVESRSDDTICYRVNHLGKPEVLTTQQVTVAMLSHLKAIAETALKTKVTDCVISVPSYFTDSQRRALLDSCQAIHLNCLRLLNDTTAAALTYGIYKQDLPEEKDKSRYVVFVDLGYSALQVAVCAFNKGKLKVLAKSFQLGVGGRHFDECLVNHFAEEFKTKYKIDSLAKPRHRLRLAAECEKLKKLLSANKAKIPMNIESFVDDKDVTARLDREEFQKLCSGLLEKIKATLEDVLGKASLTIEDIHSVEIIGGSCRIPVVKDIITAVFNKTPSTLLNMDEAVARGCALQCAILSPTFRVRDFSITDIQPYPIKLLWESKIEEEMPGSQNLPSSDMILFKEGDHIGVSKMLTFYRKEPFYLQAEYAERTTICHNSVIGRFSIKNVVATTAGEPSKLKVKVRVNTNGIFGVMSAHIVEKVVVEEPPAPPADTGATGVPEATTASTNTSEQAEVQGETKSQEEAKSNDEEGVRKQNGESQQEAQSDGDTQQKSLPDVQMSSEGEPQESENVPSDVQMSEPQESESFPSEQQAESMETDIDSQQAKPEEKVEIVPDAGSESKEPVNQSKESTNEPAAESGKENAAEAKKPKKQVRHVDLPVESVTFSLSKTDLNTVMEKEGEMSAQDKRQIEKANARNAVEEYVYEMKDKLETVYKEFIDEKDKEEFFKQLTETEDWLYEEGADESKTVYNKKLDDLKKHGSPIVKRLKEYEGRDAAFNELGNAVVRYNKKVSQFREGNEELAHIAAEEMLKVEEAVQKKQQWMHEQLQKFESLPKSKDPPVTVAQISAESTLLSTTCDPIVNKPKPKVEPPPKEDDSKKEGENKTEETDPGQPEATDANMAAAHQTGDSQPTTDSTATENTTAAKQDLDMDVD